MEQNTELHTSEETTKSTYSRKQYDDSPIWIIKREKDSIAVIGDQIIYIDDNDEKVMEELNNPRMKTLCLIAAVIASKVYLESEREKNADPYKIRETKNSL